MRVISRTPLQRTRRPHIWVRLIECMIEGFSLRKCAEQLNGEVAHVTLVYWRHKILAALKQIPTEGFQGIVEISVFGKGQAEYCRTPAT